MTDIPGPPSGLAVRAGAGRGTGPWAGVILLLLGWELAARLLVGSFVLVGPVDVLGYLAREWGLMSRALGVTLANAAAGYVIGNLAAVLLAGVALAWPRSERVVTGLALLVFCLPLVATGPILRVFFGPGAGPQVVLAALAVYYTTLIPLLVGLRAAPGQLVRPRAQLRARAVRGPRACADHGPPSRISSRGCRSPRRPRFSAPWSASSPGQSGAWAF